MANNWYLVSALTGGAAGALDALDGAALSNDARAIAVVNDRAAFYVLDANSAAAESSPDIISPDINAGDKRWILKKTVPFLISTNDFALSGSTITDCPKSLIFGGDGVNTISSPEDNSGLSQIVFSTEAIIKNAPWSSIINCSYGNISCDTSSIWDCVLLGGESGIIYGYPYWGYGSTIIGGYNHEIRNKDAGAGDVCTIVGGEDNIIQDFGDTFIGGGRYNIVTSQYGSIVGGTYARTYLMSQTSHASNRFSETGDAQYSDIILNNTTTGAVETELFLDGAGQRATLFFARSWKYRIDLISRQIAGTAGTIGDSAFWKITGAIKNVGRVAAQSTITLPSSSFSDGDTVTLNNNTYTFRSSPTLNNDIKIESSSTDSLNTLAARIVKIDSGIDSFVLTSSCVFTATSKAASNANSWVFTTTASVITIDGSGTFGGTTAGADGTVSLVGTPQGTGVPASTDRDAGAALWSVSVTADDTNKSLKIAVTGEANKTIHWVAKISLVEVG